ncbi:MAG: phosphatidylglycerol lysyltransferase domain-containing protein [Micavibrio sp.]|nr:phosphatidylglycerol lysyltransferase domain-containing protein [Micavibrio sp.]
MTPLCTARSNTATAEAPPVTAPSRLEFKKLDLADKPLFDGLLNRFPQRVAGYTFAELYSWNSVYDYEWRQAKDGTVFIRCTPESEDGRHFLQPLGPFGVEAQKCLLDEMQAEDKPMKIYGVGQEFLNTHPDFAARFTLENDDGLANYLYDTPKLATLAGKTYAKKRNQIAQARALYEWTATAITPANIAECLAIMENTEQGHNWGSEKPAVFTAFRNFAALGLKGVLLHAGGKPIAFSVYEKLTPDTAVVLFEKACDNYKGLYQVINQETAQRIAAEGFPFINREEDMGLPGLRHAKLSYYPIETIPAFTLIPR